MISTTLPSDQSNNDVVPKLTANSAIHAHTSGKYYFPKHKTPYLLVTNHLNKGNYILNDRSIRISDGSFYFLNASDELEMRFDQPLQTLLILFEENFVKDSFRALNRSDRDLLEDPNEESTEQRIPAVPFSMSKSILNYIETLLFQTNDQAEFDDQLFLLLAEVASLSKDAGSTLKKFEVAKKSTQEELYRRIFRAKEFMHDQIGDGLTLDQIANEVGMNKFHLLSNFKKMFNTTPHQYLTELRLQKALELLKMKKHSVSHVCFSLGFESVGSFSNLFKRRFNVRPSDF